MHPQSTSSNALNCKGTLAQMVEQWTENPCVPGSIPGGTTKNFRNTLDYQDITDFLFLIMYDYCTVKSFYFYQVFKTYLLENKALFC